MNEIKLNKDNFQKLVLQAQEPVLVDFWADWCGPCRMLSPVLHEIAAEGRAVVGKVNVDEEPELARQYGISAIPALILFRDGKPARRSVGYQPKADLEALLGR